MPMTPRPALNPLRMAAFALALAGAAPQEPAPGAKRFDLMDYGPVLAATIESPLPPKNIAHKGLAIRVSRDPLAYVCFDTEMLKVTAGWTGGFLTFTEVRDGLAGHPRIKGTPAFGLPPGPGWAKAGSFADPRSRPYGPLPRDWARYRGLYHHGETVVLSYTVGSCEVLESPGYENPTLFTRTLRVGPSATPLVMRVSDAAAPVMLSAAGTARLETSDGFRVLTIPPRDVPTTFKISLGAGVPSDTIADLPSLCRGGPARWKETVTTKGVRGKDVGPYTVDVLTEPEPNPWKSWMRFGGLDFFPDGRAAICTVSGDVWIVSGLDRGLDKITWRRYATGLFHALGLVVREGAVYTLGRDQITRLHDLNGDGEADFYECFNNECEVTPSGHEYTLDLQTDAEGNFYYIKGDLSGGKSAHHGCLVKVAKDGGSLEVVATGLRQGNGLGIGPRGEITCGDNQGEWVPSSRLNWVKKGGFYGYMPAAHRQPPPSDYDRPLCWIPHEVDRSCGSQVWVPGDRWGPFKGGLLHTSYGHCALYHVMFEEVGGVMQGGVWKFPLPFASGVMRARFNPADGQLYLCGLRVWDTYAVRDGGFARVRYTGRPLHAPLSLRARRTGVEIAFAEPLDPASVADPGNWSVEVWGYAWTSKYGSPKFKVSDPGQQGTEAWTVASARLLDDRRTALLEIPEIKPVMQMKIRWRLQAADGSTLSQELHNTVHKLPD